MSKSKFKNIAKNSNNVNDFMLNIREFTGDISTWFIREYGQDGNLSFKQASINFINKHG